MTGLTASVLARRLCPTVGHPLCLPKNKVFCLEMDPRLVCWCLHFSALRPLLPTGKLECTIHSSEFRGAFETRSQAIHRVVETGRRAIRALFSFGHHHSSEIESSENSLQSPSRLFAGVEISSKNDPLAIDISPRTSLLKYVALFGDHRVCESLMMKLIQCCSDTLEWIASGHITVFQHCSWAGKWKRRKTPRLRNLGEALLYSRSASSFHLL